MKVYISGPMTGIEQFNHPAFASACEVLRRAGHEAESPHLAPKLECWEAYMRYDLALLLKCDAIALLPGWEYSIGASLERLVAVHLGMEVLHIRGGEVLREDQLL